MARALEPAAPPGTHTSHAPHTPQAPRGPHAPNNPTPGPAPATPGGAEVLPHVCPFCGSLNDSAEAACPRCTMENTPQTRKATKARIGPWYVLQTRNPAAPGMKFDTLMAFVRKGRVKSRSIVRGPTTHQLWRFASQVKGLSREFGLCYSCGGSIEKTAKVCPRCNRLQDAPPNPDALLESEDAATAAPQHPAMPVLREIKSPVQDADIVIPPLGGVKAAAAPAAAAGTVVGSAPAAAAAPSAPAAPFGTGRATITDAGRLGGGFTSPGNPADVAPPEVDEALTSAVGDLQAGVEDGTRAFAPHKDSLDPLLSARDLADAFKLSVSPTGGITGYEGGGGGTTRMPAILPGDRPSYYRPRRSPAQMVSLAVAVAAVGVAGWLTFDRTSRQKTFAWFSDAYAAMARTGGQVGVTDRTGEDPSTVPIAPSTTSPDESSDTDVDPAADADTGLTGEPDPTTTSPDGDPDAVAPDDEVVASDPGAAVDAAPVDPGPDDPAPDTAPAPDREIVPPPATAGAEQDFPVTVPEDSPTTGETAASVDDPGDAPPPPSPRANSETRPTTARPPAGPDDQLQQDYVKAKRLWQQAQSLERSDPRRAIDLYKQIKELPKAVWPGGLEARLTVLRNRPGA